MADYGKGTPSMGSGIAGQGQTTVKQHRCVQDKMSLEGMTEAQANAACGVRTAKKKGGIVKKAAKPKARIHAASMNHKFS